MEFNPSKCQVVRALQTQYTVQRQVLEAVNSARNLWLDISSNISWNTHVDRITANANRSLRFIDLVPTNPGNGILISCSSQAGVCIKDKTKKVEKVQRSAARCTLSDYASTTSVTRLLSQLEWQIDLWPISVSSSRL